MSLFDLFRANIINEGLEMYRKTPNAILIDVRSEAAYAAGHIPGSYSLPFDKLKFFLAQMQDYDRPLLIYCDTGKVSGSTVSALREAGYKNVMNIGGICEYNGPLETAIE